MITIIVHFYKYVNKRIKAFSSRNKRKMLFWKKEVLGSNWIALDITKRKLLFCNQVNNKSSCLIIDLKNVSSCTIKRQYHVIDAGGLLKRKLQDYLKSIRLCVRFKNSTPTVTLQLYEAQKNNREEAASFEVKAKEWQTTIANLLVKEVPARA